MKKITFLYTHPIQYFAPLLKKITEAGFCHCHVLYCEDTTKGYFDKEFGKKINWDIPLLNGYSFYFLPNSVLSRLGSFFRLSNLSIRKFIGKGQTDILVVHGWAYFTAIFAIVCAKLKGSEVWLRGESPLNQEMQKPAWNRLFKKIFLQYGLFRLVDRFLYIGHQNRLFYKYYGVQEAKFVFCPYAVDNDSLQQSRKDYPGKRLARAALGLPEDDFIVLFSGKLITKKNPYDLVSAFHKAAIANSTLIMLGDGEWMPALQKFKKEQSADNIVLAGFKNQGELPVFFSAADIFVLPSGMGETWGLVINEAMNYELPVIVSDLVGSAVDLVKAGENGYTFPLGNTEKMAALLQQSASDPIWLNQAGTRSGEIIRDYSYDTIITGLQQAAGLKRKSYSITSL